MNVTDEMIERGLEALSGWQIWTVKNSRMHKYDEDLVRSILEAALKGETK